MFRLKTTAILAAAASALLYSAVSFAAGSLSSTGFVIDPALPTLGDPALGYTDTDPSVHFQLPGGTPIDSNNFFYPAARLGKFSFDVAAVDALFPIAGSPNALAASSLSLHMAITDLDTNAGENGNADDSDYQDIIFALSLSDADDGTGLARVLTDSDGPASISPQFITGFGNQSLGDPPDVATNTYDFASAPVLGSDLATLFSGSNGEIWLYLIDTDDFGNNISLANSLASDFTISLNFVDVTPIPLPPAVLLFGGALLSLCVVRRRNI